jgi:nucleotide-binding universal stress UspA family protein
MFERILLPLDGSEDWEPILPHLERLAAPPDSEVYVVEAVPFLETLLEMPKALGGAELAGAGDLDTVERHVAATVAMLRSRGIVARGFTQIGSTSHAVARTVRRLRVTLIAIAVQVPKMVLGTRRRSAAERALIASAAPMYVVPSRPSAPLSPTPQPFGTIVVPLDGTGGSLDVIPAAAAFARRLSAPLLFVHVVPADSEAWEARSIFQAALRRAEREGIPAETRLVEGEPASGILACCSEVKASMIAMRTHLTEQDPPGNLGSVTVQVLRAATVPMLVVRRKAEMSGKKRSAS